MFLQRNNPYCDLLLLVQQMYIFKFGNPNIIELLVSAKPFSLFKITMSKSTHFIGKPMFGQLLSLLDK